jgi:dimethylglycine dehydrogenase
VCDAVLVERAELTSGSSWHAAGGVHTLNADSNLAKLQRYTIDFYRELEEISGQSCGAHLTGGILLAGDSRRLDFLKMEAAKGRYLGLDTEMISVAEAKKLFPLMEEKFFVGAMYDPAKGHVDPAGVTHAYAKAARAKGAEIYRNTPVTALRQVGDEWDVVTAKGVIRAEKVVNAGGLWAREVGRLAGLELPLLAMEHHYIVTEEMPEVAAHLDAGNPELGMVIDFDGEIYMRQEGRGMLMGTYEQDARPWSPNETPADFGFDLLPPDWERIAPSLNIGFEHYPAFKKAGIKKVVNGPFVFAPDGNPVIGPAPNRPGLWLACGVMAGFSQGGGVGLALANWMTAGDPGYDVWAMDAARFGEWTTPEYTNAKVRENYARRFRIGFPNEELPAARPFRTTPIYPLLKEKHNAVFGASYGLEHALWFAPPGETAAETPTFARSNAHNIVAAECRAVREAAGLLEISNFCKIKISGGEAACEWLNQLLANRMPNDGRIVLSPMLNEGGYVIGDLTVARLGDEFFIVGSGVAEARYMRLFGSPPAGVTVHNFGLDLTGLAIAGPRAKEILAGIVGDAAADLKFMDFREMEIGGLPARVGRISYTGESGFEMWTPAKHQIALFRLLLEAGESSGIKLFGGRALNSLRLEKNFGSWSAEYRPIYTAGESGLSRFADFSKKEFTGRAAARKEQEAGITRRLAAFAIAESESGPPADAAGDEPLWANGEVVGNITSGGYAHYSRQSVALGYAPAALLDDAKTEFAVEILGQLRPAKVQSAPLIDPQGKKMRA